METNKNKEGAEYQDFVCEVLYDIGIVLTIYSSRLYQICKGETVQGAEIKLDERCTDTGRLSIEIAEKRNSNNSKWIPSGIMKEDNSSRYIQGNYRIIFIFDKVLLRNYYIENNPEVCESHGTIQKFYINLNEARAMAEYVIEEEALRSYKELQDKLRRKLNQTFTKEKVNIKVNTPTHTDIHKSRRRILDRK